MPSFLSRKGVRHSLSLVDREVEFCAPTTKSLSTVGCCARKNPRLLRDLNPRPNRQKVTRLPTEPPGRPAVKDEKLASTTCMSTIDSNFCAVDSELRPRTQTVDYARKIFRLYRLLSTKKRETLRHQTVLQYAGIYLHQPDSFSLRSCCVLDKTEKRGFSVWPLSAARVEHDQHTISMQPSRGDLYTTE